MFFYTFEILYSFLKILSLKRHSLKNPRKNFFNILKKICYFYPIVFNFYDIIYHALNCSLAWLHFVELNTVTNFVDSTNYSFCLKLWLIINNQNLFKLLELVNMVYIYVYVDLPLQFHFQFVS